MQLDFDVARALQYWMKIRQAGRLQSLYSSQQPGTWNAGGRRAIVVEDVRAVRLPIRSRVTRSYAGLSKSFKSGLQKGSCQACASDHFPGS